MLNCIRMAHHEPTLSGLKSWEDKVFAQAALVKLVSIFTFIGKYQERVMMRVIRAWLHSLSLITCFFTFPNISLIDVLTAENLTFEWVMKSRIISSDKMYTQQHPPTDIQETYASKMYWNTKLRDCYWMRTRICKILTYL